MKSETATGIWRKQCIERFLAYSHPLAWGFCPTQEYSWNLGSTFFDSLDKAICLKPEERLDHRKDPSARLEQYFIYETNRFLQIHLEKSYSATSGLHAAPAFAISPNLASGAAGYGICFLAF